MPTAAELLAAGPRPEDVPLQRQIACVEREVRRRMRVYPSRVHTGRLKPREAADELAAMTAVAETLRALDEALAAPAPAAPPLLGGQAR
jgi:hypothetical protein